MQSILLFKWKIQYVCVCVYIIGNILTKHYKKDRIIVVCYTIGYIEYIYEGRHEKLFDNTKDK